MKYRKGKKYTSDKTSKYNYKRDPLSQDEIDQLYPNEKHIENLSSLSFRGLYKLLILLIILVGVLQLTGTLSNFEANVRNLPEVFDKVIFMRTR